MNEFSKFIHIWSTETTPFHILPKLRKSFFNFNSTVSIFLNFVLGYGIAPHLWAIKPNIDTDIKLMLIQIWNMHQKYNFYSRNQRVLQYEDWPVVTRTFTIQFDPANFKTNFTLQCLTTFFLTIFLLSINVIPRWSLC